MTPAEIDALLTASFEDRRLSRGERQALTVVVASAGSAEEREAIRRGAFAVVRSALAGTVDALAVDWLEDVSRAIREAGQGGAKPALAEAYFSPGDECPRAIEGLLRRSKRSADVCVFTITDDRLAEALIDARRRGVAMRVITDDSKAGDLGSDVDRLERAGIPLRVDRSPFHMHHKFLVVDGQTLLTGSYNWTRGAARDNEENLIVTDDPRLVSAFAATFARLWDRLS